MYTKYFPKCPVEGSINPAKAFNHMGANGAVPSKCATCRHLFEGECLRAVDEVGRYLHLDHGPCGIPGNTDPVVYEDNYITAKVTVPRKCAKCVHLEVDSIYGFHCTKDSDIWGDFRRGLDWGNWAPKAIYFDLPYPKNTTKKMYESVLSDEVVPFVKEYRKVNPGLSIDEAKGDFNLMRQKLTAANNAMESDT